MQCPQVCILAFTGESLGKRRKHPIIAHYSGDGNYGGLVENAVLSYFAHLGERTGCDCFQCQADFSETADT